MVFRPIVMAIEECPLHIIISLDNCKKCPYFGTLFFKGMTCEFESEIEKKMKAEPAKVEEPKSRW